MLSSRFLAVLVLPLLLAACGPPSSEELIRKAEKASNKTELESAIGKPSGVSKLGPIEQWVYKTKDGEVTFTITGDRVALTTGGTKK